MSTVEWKTLGEICNFKKGMMITSKTAEDGTIPVVSGGQKPAFYHNASNRSGETITVAGSGAYAGFVSFWDKPIFVADAFSVSPKNENCLLTKYLFYYLQNVQGAIYNTKTSGGIPHVYSRFIENFIIPLPDVDNQQSIVNQLDTFTTLISRLESELELRQKQYEHYREELLNFEGDEEVEWKTLINLLAQPITDGPHETPVFEEEGIPFISVDAIVDNEIDFERKRGYISLEYHKQCCRKYCPQKGDIYLVKSGSTVGKVALVKTDTVFNIWSPLAAMRVKPNFSPKYVFYLLQTQYIQDLVKSNSSQGSQPNLSMRVLEKFIVPIPSKHRQQQIVSQLDTFEQLITALKRETALRKKQYEYYREMLLTFDE